MRRLPAARAFGWQPTRAVRKPPTGDNTRKHDYWSKSALARLYIVRDGTADVVCSMGEYGIDGTIETEFDNWRENMERIIAEHNACAGIPTEKLGIVKHAAELLEACRFAYIRALQTCNQDSELINKLYHATTAAEQDLKEGVQLDTGDNFKARAQ